MSPKTARHRLQNAARRRPCRNRYHTDQSSNPITTDQRLFARPDFGNLNTCDSGAYEFGALAPIVLNSHIGQIARSTSPTTDKVNMALNFTENPDANLKRRFRSAMDPSPRRDSPRWQILPVS